MKKKSTQKILRDYGIAIGGAILVAFFIRFFFIEAYRMPSKAMSPAIEAGDTIFVSKIAYGVRMPGSDEKKYLKKIPSHGDIVVFEFPDEPGREYIKRIVAVEGDTVQIKNSQLILNGKLATQVDTLDDFCGMETLPNGKKYEVCWESPTMNLDEPMKIGPGEIFVVGDMRTTPAEIVRLKPYGKIPLNSVRGKARLVWLSIEPPSANSSGSPFSRIRFDRMFKKIQ